MRDGVLEHLKLTKKERKTLEKNFICVFESSRTGQEFIAQLESLLEEHLPDLLILDPALSYIGGDVKEQQTVGGFLRNLLNPLLQKHNCGVLIVHHTNKPNAQREDRKRVANDFAYAGTGSAEWANWAARTANRKTFSSGLEGCGWKANKHQVLEAVRTWRRLVLFQANSGRECVVLLKNPSAEQSSASARHSTGSGTRGKQGHTGGPNH
jgi:hypothetical protein